MTEAVVVLKQGIGVLKLLRSYLDPGKRHALEEAITEHVLSEIPRILRLLEERIAQVQASGCTPEEASIITYQVIEAQKRTLDEEKRRRLTNVLVNGLCAEKWDRRLHRLLIRLANELEEEHIASLEWHAAETKEERARIDARIDATRPGPDPKWIEGPNGWRATREAELHFHVSDALTRELVSRGVVIEIQEPKLTHGLPNEYDERPIENVELEWTTEVSAVGRALLAYLADPDAASEAP